MRNRFFATILLSVVFLSGLGGDYEEYIKQADKAYDSGDKEGAKKLYLEAANRGSPEAHFAIAQSCSDTWEEEIHHYSEAAKKGHKGALEKVLDKLFFRAEEGDVEETLRRANPRKALELYQEAKKVNPSMKLFDEEVMLKTIQMSAEAGDFDYKAFLQKYEVSTDESFYKVWSIAEEVSKDERFGPPDPKLVFQLVSRGGNVASELEQAVQATYKNWKAGVIKEFNMCDYAESGLASSLCSGRKEVHNEEEWKAKLIQISQRVDPKYRELLNLAYASAVEFIELKTENEEGSRGAGHWPHVWRAESKMEQVDKYIDLLESISKGFKPSPKNSFKEADLRLNETYKRVMADLKKRAENPDVPRADAIIPVQRLWIKYRDASTKLFSAMNPSVNEDMWKSWLTELRERELEDILSVGDY